MLFMGLGLVLWAKWLMPEEEVIQDRHDDPSTEEDKLMTEATLAVGLDDTGLPRRSLILRSLGLAGGALATVPLVALVGGDDQEAGQPALPHAVRAEQEDVPDDRRPGADRLRRLAPGLARTIWSPAAIATVFPGVREEDETASTA